MHTPTQNDTLNTWLQYLGSIHSSAIDMGLERVLPVFRYLNIQKNAFVFTVAGTNGKGSTTATIAALCQGMGLKTALYQSPHLVCFTERIQINGVCVREQKLIEAFVQIEQARVACNLSLSFFEMTTLAALLIFSQSDCDVWVLEVGLGGRLDVVNVIDPDFCVITNIAKDHTDWLGDTLEQIGLEKAGILRQNSPLVYASEEMPSSIAHKIQEYAVRCYRYGVDFSYTEQNDAWIYSGAGVTLYLPKTRLALINVSAAITAVLASPFGAQLTHTVLDWVLPKLALAGRLDVRQIQGQTWLFDVAHNEAGVRFLLSQFVPMYRDFCQKTPEARLWVLFSMLADKDIDAVLALLAQSNLPIDRWYSAKLDSPRALCATQIAQKIHQHIPSAVVQVQDSIALAVADIAKNSKPTDFVLVLGSFHTISESMIVLGLATAPTA